MEFHLVLIEQECPEAYRAVAVVDGLQDNSQLHARLGVGRPPEADNLDGAHFRIIVVRRGVEKVTRPTARCDKYRLTSGFRPRYT